MEADWCNGNWWMQSQYLPFPPPSSWKQFFTSSWHWEIPLPWNLVAKFHMGFPRQWILTGLWKLHPNVCSRMCTGSHSGNFCVLWLSYMKFYTQASTSFTMAIFFFLQALDRDSWETHLIQVTAQINAGSRLASIPTDYISNGPSVHND